MSDACAQFPFMPLSTLTDGSFIGGLDEDGLMAIVWRLRRWKMFGTIIFAEGYVGAPNQTVFSEVDPGGYIYMGDNPDGLQFGGLAGAPVTAPYSDVDDILTAWRLTVNSSPPAVGPPMIAGFTVSIGPLGTYDAFGNPDNGGMLDSEILVTVSNGDTQWYCGTQYNREVELGRFLTRNAGLNFTYIDAAGNVSHPQLYIDDLFIAGAPGYYATGDFTGSLTFAPGNLWWPWTIAGTDTWNTLTGAQLRNPLREDPATGSPLAYLCTQA